jgi:hypothetical protein
MRSALIAVGMAAALVTGAAAQDKPENFDSWRLHTPTFPSTGGGGIMIGEYKPVIVGDKCKTDFTATEPNGTVYYNSVEFDAVPAQGGILCRTASGARATAAPPARRPIGSSSRTAWCAARPRHEAASRTRLHPRFAAAVAQARRIAAPRS